MFLRLKNRRRPLRNSPRFARRGVALSGFALTSLNSDYTESLLHFAFPNWLRQLRIVAYVIGDVYFTAQQKGIFI